VNPAGSKDDLVLTNIKQAPLFGEAIIEQDKVHCYPDKVYSGNVTMKYGIFNNFEYGEGEIPIRLINEAPRAIQLTYIASKGQKEIPLDIFNDTSYTDMTQNNKNSNGETQNNGAKITDPENDALKIVSTTQPESSKVMISSSKKF
jgi:hypothetical protein